MAFINIELVLYVLLAAVAGMIYSLRRIYLLEKRILALDKKITTLLFKKNPVKKPTRKRR